MKYVLLVLVSLFVSLCSYAQRDYWNDRRRYGNQRPQVIRNMRNWEQQEREERRKASSYIRNNQQRSVLQREGMLQGNRSNNNTSNKAAFSNIENNNSTQENDKLVTLVTNGTGQTQEEATRNALRSAIEQAFGTFVSANTEVLNDELVKDEITTITSGNVHKYDILSTAINNNGLYDVSLQAVVSINNLKNYAKNKGFQIELAGAEFVMNMKMRELNKKNEYAAMMHLQEKLKKMADNGELFRYELVKGEPRLRGDSKYSIDLKLLIYGNENTKAFYNEIYKTIEALSLSNQEIAEYKRVGLDYYGYDKQLRKQLSRSGTEVYFLRNNYPNLMHWGPGHGMSWLMPIIIEGALSFVIYDNLGNTICCSKSKKYITTLNIWNYSNTDDGKGNEVYYYLDYLEGNSDRLLWYPDLKFIKQIPTGFGYATKDIVIGVPIVNYMIKNEPVRYRDLLFNPMTDEVSFGTYEELRIGRIRKNCYYQLEFGIEYTEDELYKLTTISVKNRNKLKENIEGD